MTKINLLSPDAIPKQERNEILVLAYAAFAVMIVIGIFNYLLKLHSYKKIDARTAQTQQELSKYEAIVKQVDALQVTRNALVTKKSVINTLMTSRLLYPRFMEELLHYLPANVWFRTLTTQSLPEGKLTITLDAEALDNYSIADFITALNADPSFTNVELGPLSTSVNNRITTSSFRLTFNYQKRNQ